MSRSCPAKRSYAGRRVARSSDLETFETMPRQENRASERGFSFGGLEERALPRNLENGGVLERA